MEPSEEEELHEQEVDSPTPTPTPEPFQEEPKEVEVVVLSDDDDDDEDTIQEDEPIPPLGWTTKVWYKLGVSPPSCTTDLWGFFRPTTLIGT